MDLRTFRYYTAWHREANRRRYDAPADPWRLVWVAPDNVDRYTNELGLKWGLGRVRGGNWDRDENCRPVRETAIYRGLRQRFEDGDDWEETELYLRAARRFEAGETVRGYDTIDAYRNRRCEYLDELFRAIDREGYRSNRGATHDNPNADDNPYEGAYVHRLEPLAVVGRTGEILWTEGYHRLVIAKILDVEAIPAYVLCRHDRWQRVRDRALRGTADLDAKRDHPDLRDVLP